MMSRIKLDRPDDSTGVAPESDSNEFICLYYLLCENFEGRAFADLPLLGIKLSLQFTMLYQIEIIYRV